MGASFCHVDKIRPVVRSSPCRTSGSQRWVGASPIFIPKEIMVTAAVNGWDNCWICHSPISQALEVVANNISAAAAAWVRKYFVVASTARGWCCWAIRGIMASVLISNPIHAISQCELANVIVVPSPRLAMRINIIHGFISKGRVLTNMFGVWARKLI